MIVDDTPETLDLLSTIIKEGGYRSRPVSDGEFALQSAAASPPDLILLDIQMPGMDGYEVCRTLKRDVRLAKIPVIFLSAYVEPENRVKAFEVGGIDYVSKPFSAEEVIARVAVHVRLLQEERKLRESYEKLLELEKLRDSLVHMLVHDLRGPLGGIAGTFDFVLAEARSLLSPTSLELLEEMHKSTNWLLQSVTSILDVNKLEAGRMQLRLAKVDVAQVAEDALASQRAYAGERILTLAASGLIPALVDRDILFRVFQNLLTNALKFTPESGKVRVEIGQDSEEVFAKVIDHGPGIPKDLHGRIFEKFGQVSVAATSFRGVFSTGLGLPFCKLAIEAHGGSIGVESEPGKGSSFWFRVPKGKGLSL
ncbi:MAG: ATP-binding protein [Spirochaetota bacterium]